MIKTNVIQFQADVEKWKKQLADKSDQLIRELCLTIAQNIIVGGAYSPGTPVDTGYARASWYVAINVETGSQQVVGLTSKGQEALDNITLQLMGVKTGDVIYLLSNTVYMQRLEFGWSQQAPSGMVRMTMAAGQHIIDSIASRLVNT